MMEFYDPILALCNDRTKTAKKNPTIDEPQSYLNNNLLEPLGLIGLNFDFFIDWNNNTLSREIWVKLPYRGAKGTNDEIIQLLRQQSKFVDLVRFAQANNLSVSGFIFDDEQDWSKNESELTLAHWNQQTKLTLSVISIEDLKEKIKTLSGGSVSIGSKGLIYGTSRLECHLSTTDALWAGDVDLLLCDRNSFEPVLIFEFKKHTGSGSISFEKQNFSNYYPRPDQRKYDRLWYLANQLSSRSLPIFIVYYSTQKNETDIKVEKIGFNNGLKSLGIRNIEIDTENPIASYNTLINILLTKMGSAQDSDHIER